MKKRSGLMYVGAREFNLNRGGFIARLRRRECRAIIVTKRGIPILKVTAYKIQRPD